MFRREAATASAFYRDVAGADIVNSNGRIVTYLVSSQEIARDNHGISTAGIDHRNFDRDPVFLWAHDATQPPIGRVLDLRIQGTKLFGDVQYAERDDYPFADTIFRLVKNGFINAVSIGWIPLEWKYSADRSRPGGIDFSKVELLEVSQVPVPALPSALVTARSQGIDTAPLYEWTERMLDTGNPSALPRNELEILRREAKMPQAAKRGGQTIVMPTRRQKFGSLSEFVRAAIVATTGVRVDAKLDRAPSGSNTLDQTAGGFLVDTDFSEKWITSVYAGSPFLGLCDQRQTDNPLAKMKIPAIDETSRADGFRNGGMLGYWEKEGDQITASLPKWRMVETAGYKLVILVFATNELLSDSKMLESFLNKGVPEELAFLLGEKIISGTGAGVPLGIVNASATLTLPKIAGQAAATITNDNVLAMWKRLPSPSRRKAVWLVNEDADTQLEVLAASPAGPPNIYIPSGVCGNEFPLLKGRPVIEVEQCPVLGQPGDIILADLSNYLVIDGGLKSAVSMDVQFLNDQAVLRFTWYVDGKPSVVTPVSPYNGSLTRSPFVTLAAR